MPVRIAYVSFDNVPSPKGAATHIQAFAQALARRFGSVDLVTVAGSPQACPPVERWPGVQHYQFPATGKSLVDRILCFRTYLVRWLEGRCYDAVQFRSNFEGLPLLPLYRRSRLIFEVNALPSIELKYRYPAVVDDRDLMAKLIAQENACLHAAARIVTPSGVTSRYLAENRGIPPEKIQVIPNGVDLDIFQPASGISEEPSAKLVYFGTLAPWQGVELAIRALPQIRTVTEVSLTVVGTGTSRQRDALGALAEKLGVGQNVSICPPVSQTELAAILHHAGAVVVPLTLTERNTVQGCCPLKVLEGMASGTPVIATDLPVVRELGSDGEHFLLVRPGSVDHLAQTVLRLFSDPPLGRRISAQARAHVESNYTWERSGAALAGAYESLLSN